MTGVADGIASLAGGTAVLVALLVGETDEAFADIYSAAVSAQNLAPRLNQRGAVVAVAAVGVGVAAWLFGRPGEGILAYESFLFLIGSIFVPLFAVFVADYFVLRRTPRDDTEPVLDGADRRASGFRFAAMLAWALGFAAYQWVTPTGPQGWVDAIRGVVGDPFAGNAPASLVSFGAAFAAHLVLSGAGRRRVRARPARPPGAGVGP